MEHTKHIWRAVLLLVAVVIVFVIVRHFAIPASFGMHGHYRYESVAEHAAPAPVHGARGACSGCHDEEPETVSGGQHAAVSCEVCHAPLATHVQEGAQVAPMLVNRSYKLCADCHQYLLARPKTFPQVVLGDHVAEQGEEMSQSVCLECHDAHDPGA